jgi:hypothetical protein
LAKRRIPGATPDLDSYLDNASGEIFAALDGFVRHIGPGGKNDPLALGYLFLVQGLLERLRSAGSVLAGHMTDLLNRPKPKPGVDPNAAYYGALQRLTAADWLRSG